MRPGTAFWDKVSKSDGCWTWLGVVHKGYGRHSSEQAHRVAYERTVGPIGEGLEIDHLCMNPLCVRPDHLEPVTREENMRRRSARQTHCKYGHEFTPENTYIHPPFGRECRTCNRRRVREYAARKAATAREIAGPSETTDDSATRGSAA